LLKVGKDYKGGKSLERMEKNRNFGKGQQGFARAGKDYKELEMVGKFVLTNENNRTS